MAGGAETEFLFYAFIQIPDREGSAHGRKISSASIAVNLDFLAAYGGVWVGSRNGVYSRRGTKPRWGNGRLCRLLALGFGEVFLDDEVIDEAAALGGEWELVIVFELLDDEAVHHFLGVGGIGEELGVLGDAGVGLGFEGGVEEQGVFVAVFEGVALEEQGEACVGGVGELQELPEVEFFEEEGDFLEKPVDVIGRGVGIDRRDAGVEQLGEDVGGFIPSRIFQGQIGVSQPG